MAFKMKGSPMQRNFGIGVSPMKQDIDPPNWRSSSTADKFDFKSEKRANKKPKFKPDMKVKLADEIARVKEASKQQAKPKIKKQAAKTATKTVGKKAAKSLVGRIASRFVPFAGKALLAHDVLSIGGKMLKGKSFKGALKEHYLGIKDKPKSKSSKKQPTSTKKKIKVIKVIPKK